MESEAQKPQTSAEALAAHQAALRPKHSTVIEKPWGADRWNGVKGGPAGLKKI
jgi:hypothetical protein